MELFLAVREKILSFRVGWGTKLSLVTQAVYLVVILVQVFLK